MLQSVVDARKIAAAFVEARLDVQVLAEYPGLHPETLEQAYAIQDAALPLFGNRIKGWKVGRINPPWLDHLGVSRLAGPIFEKSVATVNSVPGRVFKGGFGAVEAEFVFRIGQSPKPGHSVFTASEAAELVDAVYCGFEIASSPFAGINSAGPLVTISDFGNNNGLLIGPKIPDWQSSDLDNWQVETLIDGVSVGTGSAATFPGGLIESVRFLLGNVAGRGMEIRPGMLVSTGAVTGVHEVTPGQHVEARFGDNIRIACDIGPERRPT